MPKRPWYLLGIVAALVVLNLGWRTWSRRIDRRGQVAGGDDGDAHTRTTLLFANAQMATDLLLLTLIIRMYGGVISPMAIFYVFHVAVAALLLAPLNALLQAMWALVLYSIVVFGGCSGWIGAHMPLVDPGSESSLVYSLGFVSFVYAGVAAGLLGIWYLVSHVATALDRREEELRNTTEALIASHQAIDELQARRARFMRTAAHQLKSPLAGIQTLAGLIADGVVTGEAAKITTGKIVNRCKEAIGQVSELLTLARLKDEGPERHRSAATDLVATVRSVIDNFRERAQSKGIELSLNVEPGVAPQVRVDTLDLADCLGNLIDNAIKYSGDGKRVEVTVAPAHDGASVSVRDEGIGMDADTLAVVFDEFRRGNQALSMQIPGSGLGLSIVREILEHAGGRISVWSTPGKGSTFMVWLPLSQPRDEKGDAARSRAESIRPSGERTPGENELRPLFHVEETSYAGPHHREK
ncbi:MAG: HAMP domain-containing sensor histidine kinase [Planctomycetota bacterium]